MKATTDGHPTGFQQQPWNLNQQLASMPPVESLQLGRPLNPDFVDIADEFTGFLNHSPEQSLLDDNITWDGPLSTAFNVLQPVKKQETNFMPQGFLQESSSPGPELSRTSQNNLEAVAAKDEEATRVSHDTMNQEVPKPQPVSKPNTVTGKPPVLKTLTAKSHSEVETPDDDPLPGFVKQVEASFAEMMQGIQGFRGELVVQAEFGRILLQNVHEKVLSYKEADRLFDGENIRAMMNERHLSGTQTYFTKIVSQLPADMIALVEMKDATGRELWDHRPSSWNVTYEFNYHVTAAAKLTEFIIEIDAETFVTSIKSRKSLGNIHVHGTKRHFDFSITAAGFEVQDSDQKYGELASAIENSLYIP